MIADAIVDKINKDIPIPDNAVMSDGMLHCGECGGALEKNITISGHKYRVRCMCRCQEEKRERKEVEERRAQVEKKKDDCFDGRKINKEMTFENSRYNDTLKNIAVNYCDNFADILKTGKGLMLYGGVGTGKTFFASCIANRLIECGYSVRFITISELLNSDRAIEHRSTIINDLARYDLVVIDDFGIERKTEYAKEWVYDVIDSMYTKKKCAIVTTNMTRAELVSTSDITNARVCDRLLTMCKPFEVKGTSIRRFNIGNK